MNDREKHREYMQRWRSKPENAAKNRRYSRNWYSSNRDRALEYQHSYHIDHPVVLDDDHRARRDTVHLDYILRITYGIDLNQYIGLLIAQNGLCAICARPETADRRSRLGVDHDHGTGKIRGLLCIGCNISLGYYERGMRSRIPTPVAEAYVARGK